MDSSFIADDTIEEPILPIELKPSVFRLFAYRVLSKKYGLNVHTSALEQLTAYVGKRFGTKWKRDPKTSAFLDVVAKLWKEQGRGVFIDGEGVAEVIKEIIANEQRTRKRIQKQKENIENGHMDPDSSYFDASTLDDSKFMASQLMDSENLDFSGNNNKEDSIDWKTFFRVIDVNHYTKFKFDRQRKQFDYHNTESKLKLMELPDVDSVINFQMVRLHILRDRLYRNQVFSKIKYDGNTESIISNQMHRPKHITYVKNLLGRNEHRFVLFGLVTQNSYGLWQLQDDSDKIELVLKQCIFSKDYYFVSGNFLIIDGFYSSAGKFHVLSAAHPPAEEREVTFDAFGELDFNWDYSKNGKIDLTMKQLTYKEIKQHPDHKIIVLGCHLYLDDLETISKLRKMLETIENEIQNKLKGTMEEINVYDFPVSIVFVGPFTSQALTITEGTSVNQLTHSGRYKAGFDNIANVLENFKGICENCKLVFVPGDGDPWISMVTKNSSSVWPQMKIPSVFGSKLERVAKNVEWASNPCRLNYLSQDILIINNNIAESLRRNDFTYLCELNDEEIERALNRQRREDSGAFSSQLSFVNEEELTINKLTIKETTETDKFNKVIRTVLDQGIASPFTNQVRQLLPNYLPLLSLIPLPNCVIMTDATSPRLSTMYKGCFVTNVGKFTDHQNRAHYIEYYPASQTSKSVVVY